MASPRSPRSCGPPEASERTDDLGIVRSADEYVTRAAARPPLDEHDDWSAAFEVRPADDAHRFCPSLALTASSIFRPRLRRSWSRFAARMYAATRSRRFLPAMRPSWLYLPHV